jgi:2-amino-4-hydroxy-6-hydroxymethyldihydropteridine diphosphokinase
VRAEQHRAYLNLGSNIEPETNLPAAVQLLGEFGTVKAVSHAWESRAVGSSGPNFLNACALFVTPQPMDDLRTTARSIESRMGRIRTEDPNSPRPIDIDIMMFDDRPLLAERWQFAFVLVPMAELAPDQTVPATGERLATAAERARRETWIAPRPDVVLETQP